MAALGARIAVVVSACPTVAAMSRGPFGTVATLGPGHAVARESITRAAVTVHVVARYAPIRLVSAQVRAAVTSVVADRPVHVGIDDVETAEPG